MNRPTGEDSTSWSWRSALLVIGVVGLACLPKLGNAFVWDDLALIVEGDFIHDFSNLPRAFLHDTMYAADGGKFQAQAGLDTYRPVTLASMFVDASISGRNPVAYHVDNLIVHLLCCLLVMAFATRFLSAEFRWVAPWAALWFGLHPVLGEAHFWINGRSDLWCTLFGLSALLCWWRVPSESEQTISWQRLLLVYAFCVLGLLSKETLGPALLVALVWDLGFFHQKLSSLRLSRLWLLRSAPILLSVATYVMLRATALRGLHTSEGAPQLLRALRYLPMVLTDGLVASIAPTRLMPRYLLEEYAVAGSVQVGAAVVVVTICAGLALRFRVRWPQGSFGLVWFAVVLAPASLIATLAWYGFGRYLYLPFAVFLPVLAEAAARAWIYVTKVSPRLSRIGKPLAFLALLVFGLRLALSAPQWNGPEAFYTAIIAEAEDASHGFGGLGKLLVEQGRPAEAIPLLERAVRINDGDDRYLNNLAVSYLRTGRFEQALSTSTKGSERFPNQAKFPYVAALSLASRGSPEDVARALTRVFEIDPNYGPARSLVRELVTVHPRRMEYRQALDAVFAKNPTLRSQGLMSN